MRCQDLVQTRSNLWDDLLDSVNCHEEVRLLEKDDRDMLHILLSGEHDAFNNSEEKHVNFICKVASCLDKLIYVI